MLKESARCDANQNWNEKNQQTRREEDGEKEIGNEERMNQYLYHSRSD